MNPSDKYWEHNALSWSPGLWATVQSVIGFLDFCEQNHITGFTVTLEMGLYKDSNPNWWNNYFEPIKFGKKEDYEFYESVGDMVKSGWCTFTISDMTRESAAYIINKYIKLQPHMQEKLDAFVSTNFKDKYVIGCHFRGSDKSSEARRVDYTEVSAAIDKVLIDHPDAIIFAASDEALFINYMKAYYKNKVCFTDSIRSKDHEPIHHKNGAPMPNPYKLGEDAVLDCYLLSKANILIRTQSNLSSSAANINPTLTVIDLNHAHYRAGLR